MNFALRQFRGQMELATGSFQDLNVSSIFNGCNPALARKSEIRKFYARLQVVGDASLLMGSIN